MTYLIKTLVTINWAMWLKAHIDSLPDHHLEARTKFLQTNLKDYFVLIIMNLDNLDTN